MSTILIRFGHLAQDPLPGNRHLSSKQGRAQRQRRWPCKLLIIVSDHAHESSKKSQDSTCVHSFGPMSWPSSNILFSSLADKAQ